jgi:hypothetical protein
MNEIGPLARLVGALIRSLGLAGTSALVLGHPPNAGRSRHTTPTVAGQAAEDVDRPGVPRLRLQAASMPPAPELTSSQ